MGPLVLSGLDAELFGMFDAVDDFPVVQCEGGPCGDDPDCPCREGEKDELPPGSGPYGF